MTEFMVKVNIHQLLTITVLQFTINDKIGDTSTIQDVPVCKIKVIPAP